MPTSINKLGAIFPYEYFRIIFIVVGLHKLILPIEQSCVIFTEIRSAISNLVIWCFKRSWN